MTTPAEALKEKILNHPHVAVSMLTDTPIDKQVVQIRLDRLLELFAAQQQALLESILKRKIPINLGGLDGFIIPVEVITKRIKGELGEGAE